MVRSASERERVSNHGEELFIRTVRDALAALRLLTVRE